MEILINAHGTGFTQGFVKLSCRKTPGKHYVRQGGARGHLVGAFVVPQTPSHFPSAFFLSLCSTLVNNVAPERPHADESGEQGSLVNTNWDLPIQDANRKDDQ